MESINDSDMAGRPNDTKIATISILLAKSDLDSKEAGELTAGG